MSAAEVKDFRHRLREIRGDREFEDEKEPPKGVYRKMSAVEPRQVESLWPGYIVAHKINLLAGYGGVGKGQMMCNLIARGSTGRPMPLQPLGHRFRTLILAAEDDAHEDVRPRLDANGADVDQIFIMDGVADEDGSLRWVDVKRHLPAVEAIIRTEGIDLLYIDPLSSYMPGVTRRDAGDVRDALGHIQRLINSTGVTVVGTLHLGKSNTDRKGAMKILDSVEFVNAARNVLAINDLPDEHQPDDVLTDHNLGRRKVLEVVKANSTIPGPPLAFSRPLDAEVKWHGVAPIGFDESFTGVDAEGSSGSTEAREFLIEELKGGMKPVSELFKSAEKVGITQKQLRSAKNRLRVEAFKETGVLNGSWFWRLSTRSVEVRPAESDKAFVASEEEAF
jgi:hypothetical protein